MTSHFYCATFAILTKRVRQSIEAATKGREALKKGHGGTTESSETVHPSMAIGVVAMGQATPTIAADSSSATGLEQVAEPRGWKEILEEFVEGWVQTLD